MDSASGVFMFEYIDYRPVEDKEWNELFVSKDEFKEKLKDFAQKTP